MGKTGKWLKSFLTGKKDKEKDKEKGKYTSSQNSSVVPENPTTPISILPATPKEKRRWSFRRSSATATPPKDSNCTEPPATPPPQTVVAALENEEDKQKKHALAVAAATAAAADAAVAAAHAAAAVIRLTAAASGKGGTNEEAAAIKIQSAFRSYLARKALCALRGLVKLQALVRGHLVRKQATATLRCMQALVTAQARVRAQRIRMADEGKAVNPRQSPHRRSTHGHRLSPSYHESDRSVEENIRIVEMDFSEENASCKSRRSYSNHPQTEREEHRFSMHGQSYAKQDNYQISPAPSALTDMSPKACSGHFEDYSFGTAQSSPHYYSAVSRPDPSSVPFAFPRPEYAETAYDYPLYPNYMANTESSRAKARSQSAPKSRPDSFERQPSRRRASIEGRNIPRAVRMQRSSSHVGSSAKNYQYPWSIKLDRSTVSLIESECGSTSTVLTNANYCRSLAGYDIHGNRY